MKVRKIVLIATLMMIMVACISGCGKKKTKPTINLNDYVTCETTGYDGSGEIEFKIDYVKLMNDNTKAFKISREKDEEKYRECGVFLITNLTYDVDKSKNLSNGDKITFEWTDNIKKVEDNYKVKLVADKIEVTVSNLEKIGSVDIFEGIDVKFDGIAPEGSAKIENKSKYDCINYEITSDNRNELKNGDKVIVTATSVISWDYNTIEEYMIDKYKAVPNAYEKEFTVNGLSKKVEKLDEIDEAIDKVLKEEQVDHVKANTASGDNGAEVTKMECIGNYLLVPKNSNSLDTYLYYIYKVDAKNDDVEKFTYYYYFRYRNPIVTDEGITSIDMSDCAEPNYVSFKPSERGYHIGGYEKYNVLYNDLVTKNIDRYKCESTVREEE